MNRVIQVLNIVEEAGFSNPQRGRVYSIEGVSPACNCNGGGNRETKIIENMSEQVNLPEELRGKKFRIRKLSDGFDKLDIATIDTQVTEIKED